MDVIKFPVFGKSNCKICAGRGHVRTYTSTDDKQGHMEGCQCIKKEALKIMLQYPDLELDTTFITRHNIKCTAIIRKEETATVVDEAKSSTETPVPVAEVKDQTNENIA